MIDRSGDARYSDRALELAAVLWPAQVAGFRVFMVADGKHHCRAEVQHDDGTIVAAGAWGKTATAARESLLGCLRQPSPPAPWTYHAQLAQAAERAFAWNQASEEWRDAEQAAAVFGGADEVQLTRMRERDDGVQSIQTWLHEHERGGLQAADWYLGEAGVADGHGEQMLEYALYRRAWTEASRVWVQGHQQSTEGLDLAIRMTKALEQEVALA